MNWYELYNGLASLPPEVCSRTQTHTFNHVTLGSIPFQYHTMLDPTISIPFQPVRQTRASVSGVYNYLSFNLSWDPWVWCIVMIDSILRRPLGLIHLSLNGLSSVYIKHLSEVWIAFPFNPHS